jgi:formate hydrogenlyase subunit 6/NADH:ubiquinone oxidoreductase subunit I
MSNLALKIQQYCKSLLLLDLLKGLAITGRHLFTKKITVFYPGEKTPQTGVFETSMRCGAIRTEKSGVSPASSAWPCVPQ